MVQYTQLCKNLVLIKYNVKNLIIINCKIMILNLRKNK